MTEKYRILYEDQDLMVIWKAAGVPVQSARASVPDVMSMLRNRQLLKTGKAKTLHPVNRLDQPVEGIFLVALNEKAAAELNRQVQQKSGAASGGAKDMHMEKVYRALVCGKPPKKEGTLVDYLEKDGRTNMSRVVPKEAGGGKQSELHYEVLEQWEDRALLEIRLMTGRHHQIRVQLAHAGFPIVGDTKYGKPETCGKDGANRLCLCSCKTTFVHPRTKKVISFWEEPTFLV